MQTARTAGVKSRAFSLTLVLFLLYVHLDGRNCLAKTTTRKQMLQTTSCYQQVSANSP